MSSRRDHPARAQRPADAGKRKAKRQPKGQREGQREDVIARILASTRQVAAATERLTFGGKVRYVYNPLRYACDAVDQYVTRHGGKTGVALLLGMNPGPWGMAQTGIPFGEVSMVRDWLGIDAAIGRPEHEHPKRPVLGWECTRREVSGARLWGWARDHFGTPEAFFRAFFVWNYCPLGFLVESGANLTPDKLPAAERDRLFAVCDRSLAEIVDAIEPRAVIGVGKFAEGRARVALSDRSVPVGTVLHPSPASPQANRGWAEQAERQLRALGVLT